MKEYFLNNGVKLICERRNVHLTSFCIGFNAGALEEQGFNYGTAHAVEHMLFKGTAHRTETEINRGIDEIFGFNNAMTNYPYAIYYGTVNSEDFRKGFELYSDIVLNPTFLEEGFWEEMKVIKEELRDWKEDANQSCEDHLFSNMFSRRRIKELIIGNEESLDKITLDDLVRFYNTYYYPANSVVTVVTSLDLDHIYNVVNEVFGFWTREAESLIKVEYEKNKPGIFFNTGNIQGAKLQFCYGIGDLNLREIEALKYINIIFGEGTSSILYDEVRTQKSLAYEVGSHIKSERGIKLFSINISTSRENISEATKAVEKSIERLKRYNWEDTDTIVKVKKRLDLKESLALERSIELCKRITTSQLMYGGYKGSLESYNKFDISYKDIRETIEKVFQNPSIQIFSSGEGVVSACKDGGC